MSKGSKNTKAAKAVYHKDRNQENNTSPNRADHSSHYLFSMSHAPGIQEPTAWFQMLPILFFTSVVIIITRMASYERAMSQFFWSINDNLLNDFFSYFKMTAILVCTSLAIVILLYRVFIQSFYIKKSFAYIPMIVYSVFVLLSYLFSDYKEFALLGWNDRFEGTLALLAYMAMLFYIINSVNSEKNIKWVIYALAAISTVLGLLGITQATGHDFFRTTIGKKLITPAWFWDNLDTLNFTFDNNEIYQTVYNINYVSFYLTLLIPLFGLLFIRSVMLGKDEPLYKKLLWGALFALLLFNLIGSASSSGLMGMSVVVLIAIIILNKRIIQWGKPVIILLIITLAVGGISFERWSDELSGAVKGVTGRQADNSASQSTRHRIDSIETTDDRIILGYNGDTIVFITYPDDPSSVTILDSKESPIPAVPAEEGSLEFRLDDERYDWISVKPGKDKEGNDYVVLITDSYEWPFQITEDGPKYYNGIRKLVDLNIVKSIGFENNGSWGNGRGYIWSRSLPLIKDTLLLGHGADTFCIYFPHNDYVGKYNSGSFTKNINVVVDKPHNMYLGMAVGTGVISMLALLILWGIYIIQSFLIYRKERYEDFISYCGAGIFLGICGFLVAGLVNDSSVSVMPMFYGLLGTGIAINMMLKKSLSN